MTETSKFDHPFAMEHVCSFSFHTTHRIVTGDTPEGIRFTGFIGEGTVSGPRLRGRILAGGADWALLRKDGVLVADVKLHLETDDSAIVQLSYSGLVDMGVDGYNRARAGTAPKGVFHPRTTIRMLTGAAPYQDLNRSQFVGVGQLDYRAGAPSLSYDVYRITVPTGER